VLEGKYLFDLPPQSTISDFAVWDNDTRIPGVMLEKRRANAIYGEIKQRQVDPGLLQQDDEHGGHSAFSAKVFPIPAYGTKRIELEYTEMLPVDGLTSHFTFPLKPSFGDPQRAGELNIHVHILGEYSISALEFSSRSYPMTATRQQPNEWEAEFQGQDVELKEDFSFDYKIDAPESSLSWITYRAPERISAYDLRDPALAARNPDGYFQATAIYNQSYSSSTAVPNGTTGKGQTSRRRNVIILLDTSLSMYGDKLRRAVEATDYFLHGLAPEDQFNLVLFNQETFSLSESPLAATPENVERALLFIKGSMLGGGTNLKLAFQRALQMVSAFPTATPSVILISDANPTLGTTSLKELASMFSGKGKQAPRARLFIFALGNDANKTLIEDLANATHGYVTRARETEDISVQLRSFFEKVGQTAIEGLGFTSSDPSNFYQVYAAQANTFDGSSAAFVGRYRKAEPQVTVSVRGQYDSQPLTLSREVSLPGFDDTHEHLPRVWARARVDALLHEMDLNGEREDYIAEIIRLSQRYKFVTPYTAFLAAPRALLRPRLIQPGDPVIRVKTDESVASVFAVLPFGETLPLNFLSAEKVWEGRFLAPSWMPDGTYRCRLLMTDKNGNGYQEEKSFVVDSHPPKLKASVQPQTVKAGEELLVRVSADKDTARLVAKMYGTSPVRLFWSNKEKCNLGSLRVPAGLAAGQYVVTVSAEDFAHNQSSVEVKVDVLSR
jgi:Ca-activated chloride channel family protein